MAKTVVALYDHFATAQSVVEDLVQAGFPRETMSVVANDAAGIYRDAHDRDLEIAYLNDDDDVSAGEGAGFGAVVGTLVGLGVALIPGIGPVIAAGPFAAALMAGIGAAAGAATGGIVAGLVDFGIPEEEAEYYAEGLRRGGTILSVTVDDAHVNRVESIMNAYTPVDIEQRSTTWRDAGWERFDDEALPYDAETIERERAMYAGPASGEAQARVGDALVETEAEDDMERASVYRGVRVYRTDREL